MFIYLLCERIRELTLNTLLNLVPTPFISHFSPKPNSSQLIIYSTGLQYIVLSHNLRFLNIQSFPLINFYYKTTPQSPLFYTSQTFLFFSNWKKENNSDFHSTFIPACFAAKLDVLDTILRLDVDLLVVVELLPILVLSDLMVPNKLQTMTKITPKITNLPTRLI